MGPITVYARKIKTRHILDKRYYEFKQRGKHKWLQKLCFWILDKLKCHALLQEDFAERIVIDPPKIMDKIMMQTKEIYDHGRFDQKEVFIGPEQLKNLRMDCQNFMTFTAPVGINAQVMGMDITVVPWMEGVLVVPKERKRLN